MDRPKLHSDNRFVGPRGRGSLAALALGIACVTACGDDPVKPPGPPPPVTSPEGLVAALADAYRARCLECVDVLLSALPEAEFTFVVSDPNQGNPVAWGLDTERLVTRRLLRPGTLVEGELPVPPDLWLTSLDVTLAARSDFGLAPLPAGLDRTRWNALSADYAHDVFFDLQGETDYQVTGSSRLTVLVDLDKADGEAGKYLLYRWEELSEAQATFAGAVGVQPIPWSAVKALYAAASPITSEASFIQSLANAYGRRDLVGYTSLLAEGFFFVLEPFEFEPGWGRVEEVRIHERMFEPQNVPPGEPPVPSELWLTSVTISLTPQTPFVERPDLYRSPTNPEGLDPERWRVTEATYTYSIFFELQGDTDYQANGRATFAVTADRLKFPGTPGRFALYRCEDLGTNLASEAISWGTIKTLYN